MLINTKIITSTYLILAITLLFNGCTREAGTLEPAPYPSDAEIFIDGFGPGVTYEAFGNSKVDALGIDEADTYSGSSALTITVPAEGDPDGWFAGGAFIAPGGRDLTGFNALTFWAKANQSATVDLFGFGNDNTGNSKYPTELKGFKLNRGWKKFIIPIPLPQKLEIEGGLFYFADGHDNGAGYDIWVDEVQFEKLGTLAHPSATIPSSTFDGEVGDEFMLEGQGTVTFNTGAENVTVHSSLAYFTFSSSDNNIATVDETGKITAVGLGTATISGKLGTTAADGAVTVNINEAATGPASAAPVPTMDQSNVISLFSNAYTNATVDTWSADWDVADVEDIQLMGDDTKLYKNLSYAGIEFTSSPIDASNMTNFYMNLWTPDVTADPAAFKIKLVDFGADGAFGGGDDTEHEIALTANTNPALASNAWLKLDIPLSNFAGLTTTGHIAQMIISGDPNTVYIDNILFYKDGGGNMVTEPTEAAPTPSFATEDVVSLFSNAYTNVNVDLWSTDWDNTDVADVQVAGDDVKLYTNLSFAGIEFTSQTVDASAMTHFTMDIWTPDDTAEPAIFKIKLVDFGANGVWEEGGDNVEHELTLTAATTPSLMTGTWVTLDIPLSDFAGLTTTGHIAQMIISGDPNTVYIDNILFHK